MQKKEHGQIQSGMKHFRTQTIRRMHYKAGCVFVDCSLQHYDFQIHPPKSPPILQWSVLKIERGASGAWAIAVPEGDDRPVQTWLLGALRKNM